MCLPHKLVHFPAGVPARSCAYCKVVGTRTECGRHVRSYYACDACAVPLCSSRYKDCFERYHALVGVNEIVRNTNKPSLQQLEAKLTLPHQLDTKLTLPPQLDAKMSGNGQALIWGSEHFKSEPENFTNSITNLSKLMDAKFSD